MAFLFLFLFQSLEANASYFCKGMKLAGSQLQEKVLEVGRDADGIFSASVSLENAYFSVQGLENRKQFSLHIRLKEPQPNGSGIYSDGAFDLEGFSRLSFVQSGFVYKLVCSNKGPF
jgi:hypothetical protein